MKAKKALKRLVKIEALLSDVTKRFPNTSLQIQGALKDAKAAFARVKEAVSLQVSSEAANDSNALSKATKPAKRKLSVSGEGATQDDAGVRMDQKGEAANAAQSKEKAAPARRRAAARTMVVRATTHKTATKRAPIKKAAKKDAAAKETAQAPVEFPPTVETNPATLETASATVETAPVVAETAAVTIEAIPADVEVQTEPVAQMSVGQ